MSRLSELIAELCPDGVEYKALGELFIKRNGYTPAKSNASYWENGTLPWFRMEDIRVNGTVLNDAIQHVNTSCLKRGGAFPAGSIIVATSATIGAHALITCDFLCNQRFTCLTLRPQFNASFDITFLNYYCDLLDQYCLTNVNQGSFASVKMGAFDKFRFPIPPIEIQREVVRILDEYTAAHDELVEQLEEEVTMRTLEYATIIREKFTDRFGDPCSKDSSFDRLGNHCRVITGNTPSRSHPEYYGEGIDWIKSDSIRANAKTLGVAKEQLTDDGRRVARVAEPGWLLMICIAGSPNTIGNTAMADRRVAYNQQINGIDPLDVNPRFLQCALTLSKQKIERTLKPAVTCILNKRELESLPLPFPSRSEQDEFTSMLDGLESAGCTEYVDALQEELGLRERQLASFRNHLLSFPEKVS